jgi:hypothetical protein
MAKPRELSVGTDQPQESQLHDEKHAPDEPPETPRLRDSEPYKIDPEDFAREMSDEQQAENRRRMEAEFGHLLAQLRDGAIIRLYLSRKSPPEKGD